MKSNKELVGASTSLLVLGVLAKAPSYGYEIVKRVNDEAGDLFTWQEGTVYPVLHKLEKDGYVRTQWQEADSGRRRKYYYITAKGRELLTEGVREWSGFYQLFLRIAEEPNA
ncbi:MAG: PadR family transcriptional regulator [Candidatus Latescibacterota bacterium]